MAVWLLLLVSSAAWVFCQAFQSRSINTGHYLWAAGGSFLLGTLQVSVLTKVISDPSLLHTLTYCTGGAIGVVSAMWVHRRCLGASSK